MKPDNLLQHSAHITTVANLLSVSSRISHPYNLSFMTGVCDLDIKKDLEALQLQGS